jgi:lipoprotein-anchoring transpeptidase ErfK/SrfK
MRFSRRDFLKIGAAGFGAGLAASASPALRLQQAAENLDLWKEKYAQGAWLGRALATVTLRKRPDAEAAELGKKYQDNIVEIVREVVGKGPRADPHNYRWFETPEGYLWAPWVFPMDFQPQQPTDIIQGGKAWAEVSVPWVQGRSAPSNYASVIQMDTNGYPLTLYYASIYTVKKAVKDDTGQIWYQLEDLALSMFARADGMRLITADELTPISPNVENKLVVVDLRRRMKTITALEDGKEVFYAVIASGGVDPATGQSSTPAGEHPIWHKRIGMRMSGNAGGGYDLPGVGWNCLFTGPGDGIHSTYWHNDFGIEKSHGCVNARPEDAKWLFRWTQPAVKYPDGDLFISGGGSTKVRVLV